jgi:uncharacterized membrane protein YfcA
MAKTLLLLTLAAIGAAFVAFWLVKARVRDRTAAGQAGGAPSFLGSAIGFLTNFFDTLGIGSFATTTSIFRFRGLVDDRLIPGTLNVGHAIPTFVQALIYINIVQVDFTTLALLIVASVAGAWLGARVVASWSKRSIQQGMGLALLGAAALIVVRLIMAVPGGDALELHGAKLAIGFAGNFVFGALMTLGIGLYAPCMIMVSLLGMNETTAYPIMMGSCAFLMPVGSVQFIRMARYDLQAAIGLAVGGVPGVLIAAFIVKSMPLLYVKWLVAFVVIYTAIMLLRAAAAAPSPAVAGEARVAPSRE